MKPFVFITALTMTACASPVVVDLRASGDTAQLYQRDLLECKQIIDDNRSIWDKPLLGRDPMLENCLEGRGHSVLSNS